MRKIIAAATILAALAVPASSLANASNMTAGTAGVTPVTTTVGTSQGKVGTTQFKADYYYGADHWTCSGVRQTPKTGPKQDSETCVTTQNYFGLGTVTIAPNLWASDFDQTLNTGGTATTVDNGNGTFTISLVATY